jgi:hypothetical protein
VLVHKEIIACTMLALGYGSKRRLREKRQNVNCAEDMVNDIGSKRAKEKKIRIEVREIKLLNEEIKDDRSARKRDHGQLSKQKKISTDALKHRA